MTLRMGQFAVGFVVIIYLLDSCLPFSQNCQCLYLTGTNGQLWGKFVISSTDVRYNKSECVLVFISGTEQEIIEVRFEYIQLRKGCADQMHVFPHLREPVLKESLVPEETICFENSKNFVDIGGHPPTAKQIPQPSAKSSYPSNESFNQIESFSTSAFPTTSRKHFRIKHRHSIYSSDKVLGIRLIYAAIDSEHAFKVSAKFQFIDRALFKNDGNLVPTTYCDYQFLPHPINYSTKFKVEHELWRYFHSPRYPAKYPDHIKCTYKFIGRPRNHVEVLFEEIYLLTGHSSCLHHSDKITIYDSKIPDMSSIVDVFCNEKPSMRVISSGPNLLIEFEASSNRTSNGFSAKYRFVDIFPIDYNSNAIPSASLTNRTISHSTVFDEQQLTTITSRVESNKDLSKHLEHIEHNQRTNYVTENSNEMNISTRQESTERAATTSKGGSVRLCPPGSNCDKVFFSSATKNGTIQTPMYPGPYPSRTLCRYEFQGQGRERIQIKFSEFSLPSEGDSYDCEDADTLQVFLPIRGRYEPVETLCGDTVPQHIMSNGPRMLLEFRGRHSGKGNRGFKAEYKFLENFGIITGKQLPDAECSFKYNSTDGRTGWFHSPNFPGAYPRNLECNYYFYGEPLDKVFIRFTYFDVEGIFPCGESTASDYVELSNFMSIDRKYGRFCGKREGFTVQSDTRFFRVTFRTNDRFDKTGFRASYSFEAQRPTTESTFIQAIDSANFNQFNFRLIILLLIYAYLIRGIDIFL